MERRIKKEKKRKKRKKKKKKRTHRPRQWATTGREDQIALPREVSTTTPWHAEGLRRRAHQPRHGDERATRVVIICFSRENSDDNRPEDKREPRERVSPDEWSPPTETVNKPDAKRFTDERDDGVARLQTKRGRGVDANTLKDAWSVVLDDADACHLDAM